MSFYITNNLQFLIDYFGYFIGANDFAFEGQ